MIPHLHFASGSFVNGVQHVQPLVELRHERGFEQIPPDTFSVIFPFIHDIVKHIIQHMKFASIPFYIFISLEHSPHPSSRLFVSSCESPYPLLFL